MNDIQSLGDPVNCVICGTTLGRTHDGKTVRGNGPVKLTPEGPQCFNEIACGYRLVNARKRRAELTQPRSVTVYKVGITHASVCTSLSDLNTLVIVNELVPTDLDHGWSIADDAAFADGKPHPCPCEHYPKTHRHVLLVC